MSQSPSSNSPSYVPIGGPFNNSDMYHMHYNPFYGNVNQHFMLPPRDPSNGFNTPSSASSSEPKFFSASTQGLPSPSPRQTSLLLTPTYPPGDQLGSLSPLATSTSVTPQLVRRSGKSTRKAPDADPDTLFRDLSFFVQVDLSNRSRTVTAIKKHGGKIVSSNKTADYVILYNQSKTFGQLLQSASLAGKTAVNASFVHDCVDRLELLSTERYEYDMTRSKSNTPRGKRKRVLVKNEDSEDDDSWNARI
ncbi:hypothetical protein H0H93_000706, partial [Arthromyces matolae]